MGKYQLLACEACCEISMYVCTLTRTTISSKAS